MELVVYVDGHARQITGAVEDSTTTDVVTALANANNKIGRFSLVLHNKTNNMDYYLKSSDIPYKVLQSLKDRGIDACLEICDADQIADVFSDQDSLMKRPSSETIDQVLKNNEQIYARLPLKQVEFENILNEMSNVELEEFIQSQEKTLWKNQISIVGLENELVEENDREFLQLLRQRHNLRKILADLNSIDWERQQLHEQKELIHLSSAIESTKREVINKQNRLREMLREGEALATEITHIACNY